jgi:hypothetical protein
MEWTDNERPFKECSKVAKCPLGDAVCDACSMFRTIFDQLGRTKADFKGHLLLRAAESSAAGHLGCKVRVGSSIDGNLPLLNIILLLQLL